MKWHGHEWKAGKWGFPEHGHYYPIVSAHMMDGDEVPPHHRDKQGNFQAAREAQFVEESTRDRVIKLWNATRHLEDKELEMLLVMLKYTQFHAVPLIIQNDDPTNIPQIRSPFPAPEQFTNPNWKDPIKMLKGESE